MLEVGNGGMTTEEYRAHFSLWALLAAPSDCRQRSARHETGNPRYSDQQEVIAVNQDPMGSKGAGCARMAIWKSGPSRCRMEAAAVILLNRDTSEKEIESPGKIWVILAILARAFATSGRPKTWDN